MNLSKSNGEHIPSEQLGDFLGEIKLEVQNLKLVEIMLNYLYIFIQ